MPASLALDPPPAAESASSHAPAVTRYLPYLSTGLRHSLQDMGLQSCEALRAALADGTLRFQQRTSGAQAEGSIHNLLHAKKKDFS